MWTPKEAIDGLRALARLEAGALPRIDTATIDHLFEHDPSERLGVRR